VPFNLDTAVHDAVAVAAPVVPLRAIHARSGAIGARSRNRRNAIALAAILLSFAGLAVAAGERPATGGTAIPAPIASLHPIPVVT
jgi:hypothetical protein